MSKRGFTSRPHSAIAVPIDGLNVLNIKLKKANFGMIDSNCALHYAHTQMRSSFPPTLLKAGMITIVSDPERGHFTSLQFCYLTLNMWSRAISEPFADILCQSVLGQDTWPEKWPKDWVNGLWIGLVRTERALHRNLFHQSINVGERCKSQCKRALNVQKTKRTCSIYIIQSPFILSYDLLQMEYCNVFIWSCIAVTYGTW